MSYLLDKEIDYDKKFRIISRLHRNGKETYIIQEELGEKWCNYIDNEFDGLLAAKRKLIEIVENHKNYVAWKKREWDYKPKIYTISDINVDSEV